MSKKKIIWIGVLVVFIIAVIAIVVFVKPLDTTNTQNVLEKNSETEVVAEEEDEEESEVKETIVTELEDGTLYSYTGKQVEADIVIGDNYYDTQISEIMLNYSQYAGKTIEIEGMYLQNLPYTFVGRYSTSNLCAYCPTGYSYFEYIWEGDSIELEDEESWIKVIGTVCVGNDETSYYQDYYYLDVISIEVMNEKGIDTVNN